MKKTILFITILSLLIISSINSAIALSPTPTTGKTKTTATSAPSAKPSNTDVLDEKLNEQVNQLREKIASRVAELNLVEKRGVIGTVTEVSGNKITMTDINGKTRYVDVDEITKFSSSSAKTSFGLSDLAKGTKIDVLGLYNKQSKRILARFINVSVNPTVITGVISAIDKKNYTVTVVQEENKKHTVDIQSGSKIYIYSKDEGLVKYGFSKLIDGDRVLVSGYTDKKNPELIEASRLITFPELPKDPKIVLPQVSEEPSSSPSETGKVTPTTGSSKQKPTPVE